MKRFLSFLLLVMLMLLSRPVVAQGTLSLELVNIEIRPEYDRAAVLVIDQITLPSTVTYPTTFNLQVPAQAEVYAVAFLDPEKGLLNSEYERTVQGDWATLAITVNSPQIQVEYYDVLHKDNATRNISYNWAVDYSVRSFSIAVQQPIGASNMNIIPVLTSSQPDQNGFVYWRSTPISLSVGESYSLTATYEKASDTLSTTGLPVLPVEEVGTTTPGRVTMSGVTPWVLGGIGGSLLVIGIVIGFYFRKSNSSQPRQSRKSHAKKPIEVEESDIYCRKCGKRANPGDVFCRACGTKF
jgi:hypothetical protein